MEFKLLFHTHAVMNMHILVMYKTTHRCIINMSTIHHVYLSHTGKAV